MSVMVHSANVDGVGKVCLTSEQPAGRLDVAGPHTMAPASMEQSSGIDNVDTRVVTATDILASVELVGESVFDEQPTIGYE